MSVLSIPKIPGNPVDVSMEHLPTVPYENLIQIRLGDNSFSIEAFSRDTKQLVSPWWYRHENAFVSAVHMAYAKHYPLVLSPDMIWLLIAQGFAQHISKNAEQLRSRFVEHEGQLALWVYRNHFILGFDGNDWEGVFSEFSDQIRDHIGDTTHQAIVPTFSTTGIVEKAAFEVTLMDTMKNYFTYHVGIVCGIPSFFLEGTTEDWKTLRDSAAALGQYDLDWWMSCLLPVLDEFVAASEGHSNQSFWENFYHHIPPSGCGDVDRITGVINNLFPYTQEFTESVITERAANGLPIIKIHNEEYRELREKLMTLADKQYTLSATERTSLGKDVIQMMRQYSPISNVRNPLLGSVSRITDPDKEVSPDCFASGLSKAPFTLHTLHKKYFMEFVAGYIGFAQDAETFAIRPEIGWAVRYV